MTPLDNDVEKHIIDKLALWLIDSFALCGTAEMPKTKATAIVMRALMFALLAGLAKKGSNKRDVLEVVSTNWDILVERRKSDVG